MNFIPLLRTAAEIIFAGSALVLLGMGIRSLSIGFGSPYYRLKQKYLVEGWKWVGLAVVAAILSFLIWSPEDFKLPTMQQPNTATPVVTAEVEVSKTPRPTKIVVPFTATIDVGLMTPEIGPTKAPTLTASITPSPFPSQTRVPTFTPSKTSTLAPTFTRTTPATLAPTWTPKVLLPTVTNTRAPTATNPSMP